MTTATQPKNQRPIRNGAKPPFYNYLLVGPGILVKYLVLGVIFTYCGIVMYAAATLAEIVISLVTLGTWLYRTSEQARTIISTPVGEPIPAQHGFGCLRRMWLRSSPLLNMTLWMLDKQKPGVVNTECRAGCYCFKDFWG